MFYILLIVIVSLLLASIANSKNLQRTYFVQEYSCRDFIVVVAFLFFFSLTSAIFFSNSVFTKLDSIA